MAQYWSVMAVAVFEEPIRSGLVWSVMVVNGEEADHFRQSVLAAHPLASVRHNAIVWSEDEPRVEVRVTRNAGDEVALKTPESHAVINPLGRNPRQDLE